MKKTLIIFSFLAATFIGNAQNVGIGNTNPLFPLSLKNNLGDKISLWTDGVNRNSYGFGIQGALLQIHTDISAADIAFGYGSSDELTEIMRIKGNGKVGIGTIYPVFKLDVRNGSINVDSVYRIGTITVLAVPGSGNLFVGKDAGRINTGFNNTFSGYQAGYANTTASNNTAIGVEALFSNTTGYSNVAIGAMALRANITQNNLPCPPGTLNLLLSKLHSSAFIPYNFPYFLYC